MLRNISDLFGFSIHAEDGEIGHIEDFYFDDDRWTIRYAVVNCGNWLTGRRVLISPEAFIGHADSLGRRFPVRLTKVQVKNSPDLDTHQPISRQQEEELFAYYSWPAYWPPLAVAGNGSTQIPVAHPAKTVKKEDLHLRSAKVVKKYSIHAKDGVLGQVADFVVEDDSWKIRYLVVDTNKLLKSRQVLIAIAWIDHISWTESNVFVRLTKEQIRKSPQINTLLPIDREYEEKLYQHYEQPEYWV